MQRLNALHGTEIEKELSKGMILKKTKAREGIRRSVCSKVTMLESSQLISTGFEGTGLASGNSSLSHNFPRQPTFTLRIALSRKHHRQHHQQRTHLISR